MVEEALGSATGTGTSTSTSIPLKHVTETPSDRKKSRELAEARQSGAAAPEIDVKTGTMINPHNPEFITRRPWYLGGNSGGTEGPSLDHQADQRPVHDRRELSLQESDLLVRERREREREILRSRRLRVGMWVEALRRGRKPYLICKVVRVVKGGGGGGGNSGSSNRRLQTVDLEYEDGGRETGVKYDPSEGDGGNQKGSKSLLPRIRLTRSGNRSVEVDHTRFGKETFDSKRDRWHGFESSSDFHRKLIEEKYSKRDQFRRQQRLKQQTKEEEEALDKGEEKKDGDDGRKNAKTTKDGEENKGGETIKNTKKDNRASDSDSDSDSDIGADDGDDSDDEEFVQRDEDAKTFTSRHARQGGVGGAQMKITARNLRIREDTAKYLWNLDLNSAYYDPKSRSMRDNPNPEVHPEELQFAGENFARVNGDTVQLAKTQLFAWDAAARNDAATPSSNNVASSGAAAEIHLQANPSQVELMKKRYDSLASLQKERRRKAVLDTYGGAEYLSSSDGTGSTGRPRETPEERMVRFGGSVIETTYTRDGRPVGSSSLDRTMPKRTSKYQEDVFENGHTTVWGSYFHVGAFRWGFADDHSLMRNSYCTGPNGRIANDEANDLRYGTGRQAKPDRPILTTTAHVQANATPKADATVPSSRDRLYGEADQHAKLDPEKVREALEKQKRQQAKEKEDDEGAGSKRKKYNSIQGTDVDMTEEEMEAYRLTKKRMDDPMQNINSEELLDYS